MKLSVVEKILAAAALVDLKNVEKPEDIVEAGDKVVGVLSDELIQLYGYWTSLGEKIKKAELEAAREGMKTAIDTFLSSEKADVKTLIKDLKSGCSNVRLDIERHLCSLAKDIFWGEVKEIFHLESAEKIALRAGWQVVEVAGKCTGCEKRETCLVINM